MNESSIYLVCRKLRTIETIVVPCNVFRTLKSGMSFISDVAGYFVSMSQFLVY